MTNDIERDFGWGCLTMLLASTIAAGFSRSLDRLSRAGWQSGCFTLFAST
jgi:hypothetical protein